jgi:hypothetical protein
MRTAYACYLFDQDVRLVGHECFHADSDAEAIARAKELSFERKSSQFELWESMRYVRSEVTESKAPVDHPGLSLGVRELAPAFA